MMQSKMEYLKQRMAGKLSGVVLVVGGLLLAGTGIEAQQPVAGAARPAVAQQTAVAQTAAKPVVDEEKEEAAEPKKPGNEGIKVHGHWKIEAMNPDGTGKKVYEFENSLLSGGNNGDFLLASLLSGQAVAGEWSIRFGSAGGGLCGTECILLANPSSTDALGYACTFAGFVCFPGLTTTITPPPSSLSASSTALTFSGSFTAASAGTVTNVSTFPAYCTATAANSTITGTTPYAPSLVTFNPATCATTNNVVIGAATVFETYFTGTTLATAFTFATGQLVQISVTITFS